LFQGLLEALAPLNLLVGILGVVVGIVFGAIPGLTATLAIALLVPVTFLMAADQGMIMLGGVYAGAIFGGSISAVLLNIPGTPASIVTGWEGFALARQGKAPLALGLAALSSGVGGLASGVTMLLVTPLLASLALKFGPAEYVALLLFSLAIVVVMMDTPLLRNVLGCFMGLLLAAVGLDPVNGTSRFTFGQAELMSGFNIVAVLIGFFCMSQAVLLAKETLEGNRAVNVRFGRENDFAAVLSTVITKFATYLRSSVIGIFLGILPAIGPESTPFMTHAIERRFAKDRALFGRGSVTGLIASETSISANVGGSLIPLLSLGIPGSGAAAMFIGALTLHGLRPGPLLITEQPAITYTFFWGFIVVNLFMLLFGLFGARYFAVVLKVPKGVIATFVAFFSVFGAYAVNNSIFDILVMFGATALALVLRALSIPILPVVLALILGPLLEENLVVLMTTFDSASAILERPIADAFLLLALVVVGWSVYQRFTKSDEGSAQATSLRFE
jgi:putative tricarboxylic transport membrane protein